MTIPYAVDLSVCIGVLPWGWTILVRVFRVGMALRAFRYRAPSLVLDALDITPLMR